MGAPLLFAIALFAAPEAPMEIPQLGSWVDCYKELWEGNLVQDTRSRMVADGTVIVLVDETFHVYGTDRRAWTFAVPGITDGKDHRTALRLPKQTWYSHYKQSDVALRYWPVFDGPAIDRKEADYDAPAAVAGKADPATTAPLRAIVATALRAIPGIAKRSFEASEKYRGDEHVDRGRHQVLQAARAALALASKAKDPELAKIGREVTPLFEAAKGPE